MRYFANYWLICQGILGSYYSKGATGLLNVVANGVVVFFSIMRACDQMTSFMKFSNSLSIFYAAVFCKCLFYRERKKKCLQCSKIFSVKSL
jgi:hypothetical protein